MKKIKIFFIMPTLVGGGAEKALMNVLALLDKKHYDLTVCSVLNKGVYVHLLPPHVRFIYLIKHEILFKILFKAHQKFNFLLPVNLLLRRKLKGLFFDYGICFLDGITTELLHSGNYFSKKFTWVHSCYRSYINFSQFYSSLSYVNRLVRHRYKELDGIVFVSHDSKKEFVEIFGLFPNMPVIYNPILSDNILTLSNFPVEMEKICENRYVFISIGSLIPVKNHDLLIDAAKKLLDLNPNFAILILGTGFLEAKLKSKVRDYNLENHVYFVGFTENPYKYIRMANSFVMTSKSEALPTAMLEAMILGKPIITTNVSGSREVVEFGKYGILSEENSHHLASLMSNFIFSDELNSLYESKSLLRSKDFSDDSFLHAFNGLIIHENSSN